MPGKSKWLRKSSSHKNLKKKASVHFAAYEPSHTPSAVFDPLPPLVAKSTASSHHSPHISRSHIEHVRIHPVLSEKKPIHWDVSSHPAYARLQPAILVQPATFPAQTALTVTSALLPWPIIIRGQPGSYVTVEDVLYTIFTHLRKTVTGDEFLGYLSPQAQARASEAYRRRYHRLRNNDDYHKEKRKGARRVDFLLEYNRWSGLISTVHGPAVWEMKVS